jgi:hypothetical protein
MTFVSGGKLVHSQCVDLNLVVSNKVQEDY